MAGFIHKNDAPAAIFRIHAESLCVIDAGMLGISAHKILKEQRG
jgi:hypothetical protein